MAGEVWPEIEQDYLACLLDGAYIGGPAVTAFEREWAAYCGADHAVGVANGTDALQLSLTALGVGAGDEVVVPANTFIATAAAVVRAGATPRFADVSDDTLLMTPRTLAEAITPRTRAVIIVHLLRTGAGHGRPCRRRQQAGIAVIEDAAQAHGAEWAGRRAGSFGAAACFSFYPAKNLGAFGDAGAVVTSRPELADQIRSLANHGRSRGHVTLRTRPHRHEQPPGCSAGDLALRQASPPRRVDRTPDRAGRAIPTAAWQLRVQRHGTETDGYRAARTARLSPVRRACHPARQVRAELARRGIQTGVHYPVPCHRQPPLRRFAEHPLPVAEQAAGEILSLPMFPHMTDCQVDFVCESLTEALRAAAIRSETANVQ